MCEQDIINILLKLKRSPQLSSEENKLLKNYSFYQPDPFLSQQENSFYQQKKELTSQIYAELNSLCQKLNLTDETKILQTLWSFWLPLALELAQKRTQQTSPLIVGILGGQGTGKTTLTLILALIWRYLNLSSVAISIDDLYKTYVDRQELIKLDPRLIWRGPPGTHDVELGLKVITQLQEAEQAVAIPRFDKSAYDGAGDRTQPEIVEPVDIVILEGWFVGVKPVENHILEKAPFPIVSESDRQFAQDNNQRLREYLPLWQKLDYLMIFNPSEYQYSLQWRKDAEHMMVAKGKTGMSDEQIEEFVHYFWQALHPEIYIQPLTQDQITTDLVVNINFDHSIDRIYRPEN